MQSPSKNNAGVTVNLQELADYTKTGRDQPGQVPRHNNCRAVREC